MALAPADFYAYSRATGVPVPEDPEERAEMAPEVLAFRRNQLKAPESQGPDPLSVGIGLGLAAAGLGGAAYGIRKLFQRQSPLPKSGKSTVTKADLERYAASPLNKVVQTDISKVTAPSPSKIVQPEAAVKPATVDISKILEDPEFNKQLEFEEAELASELPDTQREMRRQQRVAQNIDAREKALAKNVLLDLRNEQNATLTDIKNTDVAQLVEQQNDANLSGLNQAVTNATIQDDQRDVDTTKAGFGARQQRLMSEFGQYGAPKTNLDDPSAAQKRAAYFAAQELNVQKSKAPKNAKALQTLGAQYGLTQDEIFHRIAASSGDYRPGSMQPLTQLDIAALLDPSVPTENVKDLLGTTLAVRGGRVGRNLDYEVMAEGGGMTERGSDVDIVGEFGSDVYAYNPRTGNFEIDTTSDLEDVNLTQGRGSDYETNAADYGDVEGPGGFVSTRGFKERTKSGTTIIPGLASEAEGMVPGSLRQERQIDRVLPARETLEGDPASGWTFDPQTGRPVLVGTATRTKETRTNIAGKPIRVVQAATTAKRQSSFDPDVFVSTGAGGRSRTPGQYQGKINVDDPSYDPTSGGKLSGRHQPATTEPSTNISTQPVTGFMTAQERLIQDDKGNWFVNQAKTKIVGEEPLRGFVGSDPNPRDLSLNRNELNNVLNQASERWNAQGGGNALERQTYLIKSLDAYLKVSKQINLPILQETKQGRLAPAAFDFINNIQPGIKETNIYVKPAKVNEEGRPLVSRQTFSTGGAQRVREEPLIHPDYAGKTPEDPNYMEAVPLPGRTKISGAGGVSAQDVDTETYEGAVSYFTPRIENAPQVIKDRRTGQVIATTESAGAQPYYSSLTGGAIIGPKTEFVLYPESNLQRYPAGVSVGQKFTTTAQQDKPMTFRWANYQAALAALDPKNIGSQMYNLRTQMETKPVGYRIKSPGSFARTQNPYTAAAAPAMGPASRVLSGDYQYPEKQLTVNFESEQRPVNMETVDVYQSSPTNLDAMFKKLQAQAGRRAGKRRNR